MEERYELTEKGQTAIAEAYWRSIIAEEVRKNHMPICVCEPCGTVRDGAMVERILETIKGRK